MRIGAWLAVPAMLRLQTEASSNPTIKRTKNGATLASDPEFFNR
jgi:hypothetical protein